MSAERSLNTVVILPALQDIGAMEEEKDQLIKRVERLRKRVGRPGCTSVSSVLSAQDSLGFAEE